MEKWIELIRVRSSAPALVAVMPELRELVRQLEASVHDAELLFLQHALYGGDLAVVVVWRRDCVPRESREGLLIAEALRSTGTVDHAVWVPTR